MDFLKAITARDAHGVIESVSVNLRTEIVGLDDARGRVLAEDIIAGEAIPSFTRSLVDGYAVKAKDTQGAKETGPAFLNLRGEVRIGEEAEGVVSNGDCIYVSTGSMMPKGSDAVVMQEYARKIPDAVELTRAVYQGENICHEGEDIPKAQVALMKGRRITAFDTGILAALGVARVPVYMKPRIALISSGDEITGVEDEAPSMGKVRDINRYTITGLLRGHGADVDFLGTAKDSIQEITEKLALAKDCEMILISGGSSKGERDFITAAIEKLHGEVVFHGVNVKPGKPTIFGSLFGKPIFGLPGHPGSCVMVVVRFVIPLVRRLQGESSDDEKTVRGILSTNVPSSYGIEEYIRVALKKDDETYVAAPIFSKSAVISSLAQSDGYIIVPEGTEGLEKGETVEVHFFE